MQQQPFEVKRIFLIPFSFIAQIEISYPDIITMAIGYILGLLAQTRLGIASEASITAGCSQAVRYSDKSGPLHVYSILTD